MPPKRLGRYEILDELARGAYGIVYRARDLEIGRWVALKQIRDDEASGAALARFTREARTAARLSHPHIVRVFEMGEDDGKPWFAMELVEGMPLSAEIYRGGLDTLKAAVLFEKVARAVHFAHERGVVHRDLKPGNILVREDGEPAVTDFGVARDATRRTALTQAGELLGTPHYMAPEQISGRGADARSDVYAIGAMLYEQIARRTPFTAGGFAELSVKVLNDDPEPPSRSAPLANPELERICLRCLRKDPEERYPTAAELADDLARLGRPSSAPPLPPSPPLPSRRRPGSWIGVLGAVVAGALAAVSAPPPVPGGLVTTDPGGASIYAGNRFIGIAPLFTEEAWVEARRPGRPVVHARPGNISLPEAAPDRMTMIGGLFVDAREVTIGDYARFVGATGARAPWRSLPKSRLGEAVTGVTWDEAVAYAAWALKRLPTSAEWREIADCPALSMAAGAQEWTLDAQGEFRALCGGSDLMPPEERGRQAMAWRPRTARLADAGFRCVRDLPPSTAR